MDIVDLLRGCKLLVSGTDDLDQALEEGAREIERLRASVKELSADLEIWKNAVEELKIQNGALVSLLERATRNS